ncbi:MAG: DUF1127 domain-containing protein [Rubricella sp.]
MAYIAQTQARLPGLFHTVADRFSTLRDRFEKRTLYNRTVRELGALTGSELADLGLDRSMIRSVARKAVYGK